MTDKTRRQHLADEIGSGNVVLAAESYRQGWIDAIGAARNAIDGSGTGMLLPTDALRRWLDTTVPRLRVSGAVLDAVEGPAAWDTP
jgi:hypothetical protein